MKIKFYFKTLRANLFFYHSLLIILILFLAGAVSYMYFSNTFTNTILREQNALGTSLVSSLENEFDNLNTVSMNISYSNLLKNLFRDYQNFYTDSQLQANNVDRYNDLTLLFDSIMAIMGPFHTVSQVNLYNFDGLMIGSGLYNEESRVNLDNLEGVQNAIKLDGLKYISPPRQIEYLGLRNLHLKDHTFISLIRVFKNQYHQSNGIVEVLQDCEDFFSYTDALEKRNFLRIILLGDEGEIFYPYIKDAALLSVDELNNIIARFSVEGSADILEIKGSNEKEVYSIFRLDDYDMSLILLQSKPVLFASLYRFQFLFIFLLFFITVYTLIISYSVSARVTRPLDRLVASFSTVELNDLNSDAAPEQYSSRESFEEIDSLYSAFNTLSGKLGASLNELIQLKDQEAMTRLLALQSQMNPHFLYNNLSNISALAEEGKNRDVISMCQDISFMLRYSAEKEPTGASLKEEMDYVLKYLTCMKIRYEEDLDFTITYPDSMSDIIIPRILVQPLVENSINHGFQNDPPWKITIEGYMEGNLWNIRVKDSGIGFSEEILERFAKGSSAMFATEHLGLSNTYQRIKLIYRDKGSFFLENAADGGAVVTVKGDLTYRSPSHERII